METGRAVITERDGGDRKKGKREGTLERLNPLTLMRWSGGTSASARGTWRKTLAGRSGP